MVFFLSLFFLLRFINCKIENIINQNPAQISLSVQESKEKKVFINEYNIIDIKILDKNTFFPIRQVWLEKGWFLPIDRNCNQILTICETCTPVMIFKLKDDNIFNENNYLTKWFLHSDSCSISLFNGVINSIMNNHTLIVPDSLTFKIIRMNNPVDIKNDIKEVAEFTIKKI